MLQVRSNNIGRRRSGHFLFIKHSDKQSQSLQVREHEKMFSCSVQCFWKELPNLKYYQNKSWLNINVFLVVFISSFKSKRK